jgi:mRNA interferase MazF
MTPLTLKPGDVVLERFRGAQMAKRRPTVVLSTALYHAHRPDLVLGHLTTQLHQATTPLDYVLQDWVAAGLHQQSAFRVYLDMADPADVTRIGHLSDRDWLEVQARLRLGLAVQ